MLYWKGFQMFDRELMTALSALKRAGFEAETHGDMIAMRPGAALELLDASKGVRDRVELDKYELGIEDGVIANAVVLLATWAFSDAADDEANAKIILSVRACLRRTDKVVRRGRSELFAIVHPVFEDDVADEIAGRVFRHLPAHGRIGYARLEHPTRIATALALALDAHARSSAYNRAEAVKRIA